jgi:hypothetical protein
MKATVTLFTLSVLVGSVVQAAVMIQPTSISSATALFGTYQLNNMINKDGLSTTYASGVTDHATYLASVPTQASNPLAQYAVLSEAASVVYEMDLGLNYDLTHVILWNGPSSATTRVSSFTISVSSSPTFVTLQNLGTFTSTPSSAHPVAAESFALTPGQGRYVRMEVTNSGGTRTLIGEVAFAGAIPEPSAAMLAAISCLALFRRSRRK